MLFVIGPRPREPRTLEERSRIQRLFDQVEHWAQMHDVDYSLPSDANRQFIELDASILRKVKNMMLSSTHIVVMPIVESVATGIEAKMAQELGKPICLWYPAGATRSRMLEGLATFRQKTQDEPLSSLLERFVIRKEREMGPPELGA